MQNNYQRMMRSRTSTRLKGCYGSQNFANRLFTSRPQNEKFTKVSLEGNFANPLFTSHPQNEKFTKVSLEGLSFAQKQKELEQFRALVEVYSSLHGVVMNYLTQVNTYGSLKAFPYFQTLTLTNQIDGLPLKEASKTIQNNEGEKIIYAVNVSISDKLFVKTPVITIFLEWYNFSRYGCPNYLSNRIKIMAHAHIYLLTYHGYLFLCHKIIIPFLSFHKSYKALFGLAINFSLYWLLFSKVLYYSLAIEFPSGFAILGSIFDYLIECIFLTLYFFFTSLGEACLQYNF